MSKQEKLKNQLEEDLLIVMKDFVDNGGDTEILTDVLTAFAYCSGKANELSKKLKTATEILEDIEN